MHFDERRPGNKSTRERSLIRLLKSSSIKVFASGISCSIFLTSDPNELCNRFKLILKKKAGNQSKIIAEENVAIADNSLEYK